MLAYSLAKQINHSPSSKHISKLNNLNSYTSILVYSNTAHCALSFAKILSGCLWVKHWCFILICTFISLVAKSIQLYLPTFLVKLQFSICIILQTLILFTDTRDQLIILLFVPIMLCCSALKIYLLCMLKNKNCD